MTGRHAEAIALGEQMVARTRAPVFVGVLAMVLGRAGRLDDARRLGEELYERAGRGEYVSPVSLLALALGLGDDALVERCLAACAGGGAAPFAVAGTTRWLLDPMRAARRRSIGCSIRFWTCAADVDAMASGDVGRAELQLRHEATRRGTTSVDRLIS